LERPQEALWLVSRGNVSKKEKKRYSFRPCDINAIVFPLDYIQDNRQTFGEAMTELVARDCPAMALHLSVTAILSD
jgi:hypothetical protein